MSIYLDCLSIFVAKNIFCFMTFKRTNRPRARRCLAALSIAGSVRVGYTEKRSEYPV